MPEIDYEAPLDDGALEWVRVRLTTVRGRVETFMIQYETTLNGERVPVVRYDNAHEFPHRDELDSRGQVRRKIMMTGDPDPKTALAIGRRDIMEIGVTTGTLTKADIHERQRRHRTGKSSPNHPASRSGF